MTPMTRRHCLGLAALLTPLRPAWANDAAPSFNAPVPGGVVSLPLGRALKAPQASLNGAPVLVMGSASTGWAAVVGLPLSAKPGPVVLQVQEASGAMRNLPIKVNDKRYAEQRLTVPPRPLRPNSVASLMRCASPPDSVGLCWPSVR